MSAVESWALARASGPVRVSAWERAEGEEVGRSRVGSGREGSWARRGEGGPANGLWGGFGFLLSYFYFFSFFYF